MASILTYSVCSFASGLSTSIAMLASARFVLGLGMGGEWNTGATLVAESWPAEFRAKAISLVQSSWALGFAAAALVAGPVARYYGWRAVFFVGILPAFVTLWIQRSVPESEMWREAAATIAENPRFSQRTREAQHPRASFSTIFKPPYVSTRLRCCCSIFWDVCLVGTVHLASAVLVAAGGAGRAWVRHHGNDDAPRGSESVRNVSGLCQLWLGCRSPGAAQGFSAVHAGGRSFDPALCCCAIARRAASAGHFGRFFGTGIFSGSGIMGSEIFPTAVRARALGFTYNGARTLSSVAPLVIGRVGQTKGLSWAFYLCAAGYLLAALMTTQLPETKGKALE